MARKQATIVNCDNCKFLSEVDDLGDMPKDWYHIALPNERGKLHPTANGFDFCSLDCIIEWSNNRKVVWREHLLKRMEGKEEPKEEPEVKEDKRHGARTKYKCEYCDQMISHQGRRMHMRFSHPDIWHDWALENGMNPNGTFGKVNAVS